MRIFQNLAKFGLLVCLALGVLALSALVGLMNYQGLVSGIELLNLENKPLGSDNLIGWVFDSLTPDAAFSNFLALVITALIFMGSLFLCHQAFKIVKLVLNLREYQRLGQGDQMWQAVAQEATWFLLLGVPLCLVAWGDIYLFQYRALVGAMNITNPEDAVKLLHWSKLPNEITETASVMFLKSTGMWMYFGATLLTPISLEYLLTKMGTTWTTIENACREQFTEKMPNEEQVVQQFYGYDAEGNPVYDPNTPIAYDVDQNPVSTVNALGDSTVPYKAASGATEHRVTAVGDDAEQVRFPVIGAQPEEELSLAEALSQCDRYHVERATRRIYARAYWDTLHAQQHTDTHWTMTKEAA
jgi:hypothetical protein